MIVVLDTTVLVADPLFRSTAWKILVHASRRHGVRVCISDVVRREAVAGHARRVDEALVGVDRWESKHATVLGLTPLVTHLREQMSQTASSYEETLAAILDAVPVEVLPIPDVDHAVLVDRAARRVPPCDSKGDGYRDTLNWFALRSLAQENEDFVLWVSGDTGDFTAEDPETLHPDLLLELEGLGCAERVSLASSLTSAALSVAATFAEPAKDLASLQRRLTATDLADFVKEELLGKPADIDVSSVALALPARGLAPALGKIGPTIETTIEVKAPLESGEAAVEVTVSCETAILVDQIGPHADLGEAFVLISDDEGRQIYETTKVVSFTALVTVDEFDRPIAGELISVRAPAEDPGHTFWRTAARVNLDPWRGSAALAESLRNLSTVSLSPETLAAIRKLQNPTLSPETLAAIRKMSTFTLPPETLAAIRKLQNITITPETLAAIKRMQRLTREAKDAGTNDVRDDVPESEPGDDAET